MFATVCECRYVAAMYWTFATISTTGFGDIVPITNSERIFSMWGMCLGLTVFSYFITVLSNILSVINASSVRAANQTRVRESPPDTTHCLKFVAAILVSLSGVIRLIVNERARTRPVCMCVSLQLPICTHLGHKQRRIPVYDITLCFCCYDSSLQSTLKQNSPTTSLCALLLEWPQ